MLRVKQISFQNSFYNTISSHSSVGNSIISQALEELKNIQLSPNDIDYVKNVGANPPFSSGKEAYDFIKKKQILIKFEKLPSKNIHAQWDIEKNTIRINERYKNTKDKAVILAISEAILHETGHAKDDDGDSSIQEELDCLSLNAMAHRDFKRKYSDIFKDNNAPIIKNGVCLYSEIYFEPDKQKLFSKVKNTYGHLKVGDEKHSSTDFAKVIKYRNF